MFDIFAVKVSHCIPELAHHPEPLVARERRLVYTVQRTVQRPWQPQSHYGMLVRVSIAVPPNNLLHMGVVQLRKDLHLLQERSDNLCPIILLNIQD